MPSPGININLFDATVFAPATSNAIVGVVGGATKGPVNRLTDFTDEGNFVAQFGRPLIERTYAQRAAIRYLKQGSQLKFNRVAGTLLATAHILLLDTVGLTEIALVEAASAGTWANGANLQIAIVYNPGASGPISYNVYVYEQGQLVETFLNLDNGIVETTINNGSSRIRWTLRPGAGNTFPRETTNPVTGQVDRTSFAGGDDGIFASTRSPDSTTGPLAGKRFYGLQNPIAGSRTWATILTIPGTLAGLAVYYGTLGMPVVPGTLTLRVQTGASTFVELADSAPGSPAVEQSGVGVLEPSAGAHVGFIDYRTGAFGVRIDSATFFVGGTFSGIWVRGATEAVGSAVRGQATYAGGLSNPAAPGFFNANKLVITYDVEEQVGQPALSAAGAASTGAALKTLAGYIVPGTLVLTPFHATDPVPPAIYDDGFGGLRTAPNGGGVPVPGGVVNYRTGVWTVTTWDPVGGVVFPSTTPADITGEYTAQMVNQGGNAVPGDVGTYVVNEPVDTSSVGGATVTSADTNARRITGPIFPGSVVIRITDVGGSPYVAYDNGVGGWSTRKRGDPQQATVTGTVDYTTGAWSITPGAAVAVGADIFVDYVSAVRTRARRALRGSTTQLLNGATTQQWGLAQDAPAAGNAFDGSTFLDHGTGALGFKFNLQTTGVRTFDLKDTAPFTAVYAPAVILGWGDGTTVIYAGDLPLAPYRRQTNRLRAFQSAQVSVAAAGDAQIARAVTGATPEDDFWADNVVSSTDPDNFVDFGDGNTSIEWTGAPLLDEATFVIAEETIAHITCRYPSDIGNQRPVLADGLWVRIEADPTVSGTLRLQVRFGATTIVETFGQAVDLEQLALKVNDETNGSDLITMEVTAIGPSLPVDTGAAQDMGMAGAYTLGDAIGVKTGSVYTGLQQFRNAELVPCNFVMMPGLWHRQVITAMKELCERQGRNVIGVIPFPDSTDPFVHKDFSNGEFNAASLGGPARATAVVPFPPVAAIDSRQLATILPWVQYFDGYANREVWEPADGELGYLVARTEKEADPWFPIAGYRRGVLAVTDIRYYADKEDRDLLYGLVGSRIEILNIIVRKTGRGLALFGQRTAQRVESAMSRINVTWTINVIQNLIDFVSQTFLFELNDAILWREAEAAINSILNPIVERRGLTDAYVVIDGTTTLPADVDRLQMKGKLFVKPARAVEEIEYAMILTPTGASFEEVKVL